MKRRIWSWGALGLASFALACAGDAAAAPPAPSQPVIVHVSDGGFHWSDAAIGAAGAVGLILVAAATWLALGIAGPRNEDDAGPRLRAERRLS